MGTKGAAGAAVEVTAVAAAEDVGTNGFGFAMRVSGVAGAAAIVAAECNAAVRAALVEQVHPTIVARPAAAVAECASCPRARSRCALVVCIVVRVSVQSRSMQ